MKSLGTAALILARVVATPPQDEAMFAAERLKALDGGLEASPSAFAICYRLRAISPTPLRRRVDLDVTLDQREEVVVGGDHGLGVSADRKSRSPERASHAVGNAFSGLRFLFIS